jgi:Sulfotransferase family
MLGRHSGLYGFPELNLFIADTVGELVVLDSGAPPSGIYLGGLMRAVAELLYGGQTREGLDRAHRWILDQREWPTRDVFECLLQRIHPRRGVDKSPRTAMSRAGLGRASAAYPHARFLHLTRHPAATIRSMVGTAAARGQITDGAFAAYSARLWIAVHRNIVAFTCGLPDEQRLRVRAEDLLADPGRQLATIVRWLGLDASAGEIERMQHPETSPFAFSLPMEGDNDSGFLRDPRLRMPAPVPGRVLESMGLDDSLLRQTIRLADELGYAG